MPSAKYADFVLIDLYSQRQAVRRYIDGWSKAAVLTWLCHYGHVTPLSDLGGSHHAERYVFEPWGCQSLATVFLFEGDEAHLARHGMVLIPVR